MAFNLFSQIKMICTYCQGFSLSQSRFYQISNVKQRFIPTYYHHPIFSQAQPEPQRVRCTPTYHSKAMDISGYHRCNQTSKDCRPKNTSSCSKIPKSTYKADYRRCKDETFYNYRGGSCYNSRCGWYDGGKQEILINLNDGREYSRERKLVDLASSSVFEGYTLQPYHHTKFEDIRQQQQQLPVRELEGGYGNPNPQEFQREEAFNQTIDNQEDERLRPRKQQVVEQPKKQQITQQQTVTFGKRQQDHRSLANNKTKNRPSKAVKNTASTKPCFTVIRNKK